jgi:adenosylhomocysteine nucleosidase
LRYNAPVKPPGWLILTALAMEAKAITAELGNNASSTIQIIGIKAGRIKPIPAGQFIGIILAGLAGGLNPDLSAGEVIIEGSPQPPFRSGRIHTSDHLVTTSEEKQRLFNETGCDAVDMEGTIVRKFAESAGLSLIHIRAISDSAHEAVPERMMSWIDDVGQPQTSRIAADLALHPGQIPAMIRLGKNSRIALRNLSQALSQIVQSRTNS